MATIYIRGSSSSTSSLSAPISIHNYLNDEQSEIYGKPIELYLFDKDVGSEFWSYTSSDSDVVFNGRTYKAKLIKRSDITLDSNSLKTLLEVEVQSTNVFVRNFISGSIEGMVQLTIYRQHSNSYVTYWKGFVLGVKFKSNLATIFIGLKISSLKRFGLMRKFQRNCGIPLYSAWCTILKSDATFKVSGSINTVDGITIDATVFGTKSDGWFKGGIFKTDNGNALQRIISHTGSVIKISRSVSAIVSDQTFVAWAGCDHLKATCKDKFSNKLNYGGQPYLPDKNPFTGDGIM